MNVGSALILLGIYCILMLIISVFLGRKNKGFNSFMVANRKIKTLGGSVSIAATWVLPPVLFISAQQAFQNGWVGFAWFSIPNVFALFLFGIAASRIRKKFPNGFTLPDLMLTEHGNKTHSIYLLQFTIVQICSFAMQLLAGAFIVGWLTGINFFLITIILSAVALTAGLIYGLKASIITDFIKMAFIVLVSVIAVPIALHNAGGFSTVINGIGGMHNRGLNFFSPEGIEIMFTFGIITTIGVLSGPIGEQTFWQRSFAIKKDKVKKACISAGLIFSIVPIAFSILGFIGAANGITGINPELINIIVLQKYLPPVITPIIVILIISGLTSTMDSNLCAISSLVNVDLFKRITGKINTNINVSRIAMILLAILGIGIANIPGLKILHLFLFYGTLRAATLLPTLMTTFGKNIYSDSVFWGILVSMVIGIPTFVIGKLTGNWQTALTGNIITVLASGIIAYTWSSIRMRILINHSEG